jgi:SIR2-like domain
MRGLVLGEYALLLGAGASRGATNSNGETLPAGNALGAELAAVYGIPDASRASLREIYDLSERIARRNTLELPGTFLRRRFMHCSVPEWYENLVSVNWKVIWNLNIDDVLERAYKIAYPTRAMQNLEVVSWDSKNVYHREPAAQVTCAHLHGMASRQNLIFGSLEYLSAVERAGSSHRLFWDSWSSTPTVVVGASLSDEIDMAAPLSSPKVLSDQDAPSVVICPDPSDFDKFRLESTGLVLIDSTAEAFFSAVEQDWSQAVRDISGSIVEQTGGIHPQQAYFLQHFRPLRKTVDKKHDFFAGNEPAYADILADRDAPREIADISGDALLDLPDDEVGVLVFAGDLSGATTAELRYLRSCEQAGLNVVEYDGEAAFDKNALLWAARHDPSLVFRINDLADFPEALTQTIELATTAKITLRIVSSSRSNRLNTLQESASGHLKVAPVPHALRDREIRGLLATLESNHRLTTLIELDAQERFDFFAKDHRRSLVDGLSAASRGHGFTQRMKDIYDEAIESGDGIAAQAVLVSAELGHPLAPIIISRAAGKSVNDILVSILEGPLAALTALRRGLVTPRHYGLIAKMSRGLQRTDEHFSITVQIARSLEPHLSPETIRLRTRAARIAAKLMDADRIVDWYGAEQADSWYENLLNEYGWNSRYWEQRALVELKSDKPRFERAESWAREAVAAHRDPYSLNTLATVILRHSVSRAAFDEDSFFEGLAYVEEAQASLWLPSEHPYITALSYLRQAMTARGTSQATHKRLIKAFNNWKRLAQESACYQSATDSRKSIDDKIASFMRSALAKPETVSS